MFQGTGSGVGKSVLAAGFCRLLKNRGFRVLPFKAQNMALNSGVTPEGLEMGRGPAALRRVSARWQICMLLCKNADSSWRL